MSQTYFQKGFGLKSVVGPVLAQNYDSAVVDRLKAMSDKVLVRRKSWLRPNRPTVAS